MRRIIFVILISAIGIHLPAKEKSSLKVSILGDSYSTFEGWVHPGWNAVWYYPKSSQKSNSNNDVKHVEQMWWHQVISDMGYILEKNNSFSGSTICYTGYMDKEGNHSDYSDRSFIGRAADLGHPDVILVCGGTNDSWCGAPIGEYKWKKWTNNDLHYFRPAMAKMCSELKSLYPQARIIFILNCDLRNEIVDSVHLICKHYRIEYVDLHDINKQSGHPSQTGMRSFADQVESKLMKH